MTRSTDQSPSSLKKSHSISAPLNWDHIVAAIALQIRQSLDLATILRVAVEEVQPLLGCDRALIYQFDPDRSGRVVIEAISDPQWSLLDRVVHDSCFESCWLKPYDEGRVWAIADVAAANLTPCHADFLAGFSVKANLIVPVIDESRLWGLLIAHNCTAPRPWSAEEIEGLQHIAVHLGIAIHQSELVAQLQAAKADLEAQVAARTQALEQANQQLAAQVVEGQTMMQTLRQSRNDQFQLAAIVTSSEEAIIGETPNGVITSWNQAAESLFGYDAAAVVGHPIAILIPPDRQAEAAAILQRIALGGRVETYETQRLHKDGSLVDVALTISPIRDETGRVIGASKIARDIRAQKRLATEHDHAVLSLQQSHAQLKEQATLLQIFYDTSPLVLGVVELSDDDILHTFHNPATLQFFGVEPAALDHQWATAIGVPPDHIQRWLQHYRQSQEQQRPVQFEYEHGTESRTHWLSAVVAYLGTASSGRPQFSYMVQDITERKQLEAEQQRAEALQCQTEQVGQELKLLENILDIILAGYWDWDIAGNQEYLSPGFKRMFGYADNELENSPDIWQQMIFPEDLARVLACFERHIQSHGDLPYYTEVRYHHKDGSTVWVVCSGQVIEWGLDGSPIRMIGCHIDITNRKQTELALQTSEATNRALIDAIPDFLVRMRQDGLQKQVINHGAIHVLQVNDAIEGHWVTEIMPEAIAQERIYLAQQAIKTGQIQQQDYQFTVDGNSFYEEARIAPIWGDEVLVVVRDISNRKQAEIELKNLSDRLTLALNAGKIGTWYWNLIDDLNWDDRLYEIYGLQPMERPLTYQDWRSFIFSEDILDLEVAMQEALAMSMPQFDYEFRIHHSSGEMRWIKTSALVQRDAQGNAQRMVGINYDITDRKQSELNLKSANDQLELVLQASSEGFWDWNLVTDKIYFSPQWKAMLGYADHELENSPEMWKSLIFEDDLATALQRVDDYNNGRIDDFISTQKFHHKDGSIAHVLSRAIHLKDDQGNVVRMVGSHLDMTQLVQIQTDLQISEMQLSGILNSSLDGIMAFRSVRDGQGTIVDFEWLLSNPTACQIIGREVGDIIGKWLLEEMPGNREDGLFDLYVQVVESGEPIQRQFYYNHDSIDRWFENIAVKVGDGFAVTFRDITAIKQSEMTLQQTNQQLNDRIGELDQRHDEMVVLSEISDFLQACSTVEEACTTIINLVELLFPICSGGIFMTSVSRNRLEKVVSWGSTLHSYSDFEPHSCWGLRRGRMHWAGQNRLSLRCSHIPADVAIADTLCIPMMAQGETLGLFYLSSETPASLAGAKQQLACTLAEQVGMAIANLKLQETLKHQSIRDSLTGLYNRRYLEESLTQELVKAQRKHHSIGVIMIDIDHFKRFNDTFGHDTGDAVLQMVGTLLKENVRNSDIACRYGGEEMMLILPEVTLAEATARAEMLRIAISEIQSPHKGQILDTLTASFGVACFPQHGSTSQTLIKAADAALYRAKEAGRNQVLAAL